MKTLFILNDAPYGTERCCNGLRPAGDLAKRDTEEVKVSFITDWTRWADSIIIF